MKAIEEASNSAPSMPSSLSRLKKRFAGRNAGSDASPNKERAAAPKGAAASNALPLMGSERSLE